PGMQDVPVMFISRTQLPDIVRRSHEAGAAYYLRKPIDPEVLIDLVGKALWLPHLVHSRISMHQPATQAVPPPRKMSARAAAIQAGRSETWMRLCSPTHGIEASWQAMFRASRFPLPNFRSCWFRTDGWSALTGGKTKFAACATSIRVRSF